MKDGSPKTRTEEKDIAEQVVRERDKGQVELWKKHGLREKLVKIFEQREGLVDLGFIEKDLERIGGTGEC